jgi:hypothetical protein
MWQGSQCSESRASHHENALRALQLGVRLKVCWIETATYGPTIGECNPLVPCHSSWAHRNGAKETCFFFPPEAPKSFSGDHYPRVTSIKATIYDIKPPYHL